MLMNMTTVMMMVGDDEMVMKTSQTHIPEQTKNYNNNNWLLSGCGSNQLFGQRGVRGHLQCLNQRQSVAGSAQSEAKATEKAAGPCAGKALGSLTMFGSLDGFSMDFRDHDVMKIFVRRNGTSDALREVFLPPNSKISDLLEKCTKALDLEVPALKAFHSNGVECTDVDQVDQGEVIHVSCGEAFKVTDGGAGTQVVGDYVLHEKLGQGGFGCVMKGVHVETGEAAAVKFVPKKSFRQFSDLQRVFQEIQALRNLRHPHIIRVLDVADHPDSICFIMEYAAGGELRGYVEEHSFLEEDEARTFFKQIVRAVHYIHSKKIIHRDLKLENVLLDAHNRCKIVDFGLSDYVSSKERTVTDAGTEAYLAPEVFNGSSGDSDPYKLDVWALGVILFALCHGRLPFGRPDRETCAKIEAEGLSFKETISPNYRRIVRAMLTPRADRRAFVDEILLDSWVSINRFADCAEIYELPQPSDADMPERSVSVGDTREEEPQSPMHDEGERVHSSRTDVMDYSPSPSRREPRRLRTASDVHGSSATPRVALRGDRKGAIGRAGLAVIRGTSSAVETTAKKKRRSVHMSWHPRASSAPNVANEVELCQPHSFGQHPAESSSEILDQGGSECVRGFRACKDRMRGGFSNNIMRHHCGGNLSSFSNDLTDAAESCEASTTPFLQRSLANKIHMGRKVRHPVPKPKPKSAPPKRRGTLPKCIDDSATERRPSFVWLAPFRLLWSWLVRVCRALGTLGTAAAPQRRAPLQAEESAPRPRPAKPATKTNISDALVRQLLTLLFNRTGGQIVVEQDVEQACEAYLHGCPWDSRNVAELIVMRGPPGVGKSTRAREILSERLGLDNAPSLVQQLLHICSTDDFFTKFQSSGQVYTYDKSKLGRNHAKNQERVKILTRLGVKPIIVDNTNMSRKEMSPYLRLAQEAGYKTRIVHQRHGKIVAASRSLESLGSCPDPEKTNACSIEGLSSTAENVRIATFP
eukprot:s676_g7.t2